MKQRDIAELLTLAALWGGSFLFMRVAAPEFGPFALAGVRVIGGTLVLLPLMAMKREIGTLMKHWKPILLVGITNSALPFLCFSYAALHINAGLSSIFNASTPLWGAAIAWLWLRDKLTPARTLGLLIGFAGVFWLAWSKASLKAGTDGMDATFAILAVMVATISYGFSASFAKRYLTGVPSLAVAGGSQLGAALALVIPTLVFWPRSAPSALSWANVAGLAILCTGLAYVLYFRLIAHIGPANAITVTFLIPAFAVAWGAMFLGETLTPQMLIGCLVILLGTSLATGLLQRHRLLAKWA
ncbi:MAG TPA: DMT family transporter [Burkholderiaceae bacterium]|jgi:drug/metabolite transporter (DMT)-like permease|nr:DMT family transporter [Burkholderiaceae bacterium]